jgi:hypothetical protein
MSEPTPQPYDPDFKSSRSDLVIEIKGLMILLNEKLSGAETEHRFVRSSNKPSSIQRYAEVYNHLAQLVKLTREILPPDDLDKVEKWLGAVNGAGLDRTKFLRDAQTHSRMIQQTMFAIGIKDTNVKKPTPFKWGHYLPKEVPE